MFEQAVLSNGPASKRVWTTFAGVTGQALLVTFAVMIPMIWPEAMPSHQTLLRVFTPTPPPAPPPAGERARAPLVPHAAPRPFNPSILVVPRSVPAHPIQIVDEPPVAGTGPYVVGGIPGGSEHGIQGGTGLPEFFGTGAPTIVAPPKPVEHAKPAPTPAAPTRVPAGGRVDPGVPIYRVEPHYPPLAITAHVSGVVELEGVIGVDGRIHELKVKSGHPLLVKAALDAVRQWVYRPTRLNEQPVEVVAPITVTFRLN